MKTFSHKLNTNVLHSFFALEKRGEYQRGIEQIREFWDDFNNIPTDLEKPLLSELLLRTGALIGFLGSIQQVPNAQEQSKNLLTQARENFLALFDFEKAAECENYLALAYWRMSSFSEAESWLYNSFAYDISETNYTKLYSNIIQSLILLSQKEYEKVVNWLKPLEKNFVKNGDTYLLGCFSSNLALAYKNSQQNQKALNYLLKAQEYHTESCHITYLASVQNNLAQLYKVNLEYNKAHLSVDSAISIYENLKDRRWLAVALDTKALIYFEEQNYENALKHLEKALQLISSGEDYNFLTELYATKIKILVSLNHLKEALTTYAKCFQIISTYADEVLANNFTEDFYQMLLQKSPTEIRVYNEFNINEDGVELTIPKPLASCQNLSAVRVNSNKLKHLGICEGMIVLVNQGEVKNGDLVAINETKTNYTHLGYIDKSFGLIGIEKPNSEPLVFDENEVEILGKILGFGQPQKTPSGKEKVTISLLNLAS